MPHLAETAQCTGCSACASICPKQCIAMKADADGFRFPQIDATICITCGLCEQVCPVLKQPELSDSSPEAYAAYSTDEAMRLDSSSGGIFTELARTVLAQNGAVFGAAYDERFQVFHTCVEDAAGLAALRGAKYSQSNLGDSFQDAKKRLESGQNVLFSGTPCQIAGLKSFLRKKYANLITVDFVCHGVPSPMAWEAYVHHRALMDQGGTLPKRINLRSKETGWSRYRYSNLFLYPNGSSHVTGSGESLFMKLFVGDFINRESCASCPFKGYSRVSDLTIGDFWGIWDIAPEMDDDHGTSVVLVHSDAGRAAFDAIQARCKAMPLPLAQTSAQNSSMLVCSQSSPLRAEALARIRNGNIQSCEEFFEKPKVSAVQKLKRKISALLLKK